MNEPLASEIATLLQQWGFGTVGTNIFIGDFPDTPIKGILLIPSPSPSPERYIDTEYKIIDFWYIDASAEDAFKKLRDIYNALNRREHYSTTNWYIYFSEAIGDIEPQDRNQEGSKMLRLSIQFISRNLNNVS